MRVRTVVGTSIASICGLALAVAPSAGAGASTASNQAAATKSVTAAFTTLFNAKDKNKAAKEALLEDPSKLQGRPSPSSSTARSPRPTRPAPR